MRLGRCAAALLATLLACALVAAPAGAAQAGQGQGQAQGQKQGQKRKPKPKPKPKPETPAEKLGIYAEAWGVMDARTGELLLSQAASKKLLIASATKLMTAYVAMKEMPLDEIVRAVPYDAEFGESLLELKPGQKISVRDLIYGLILRSGNDAAHTLAVAAAGSQQRFVNWMNRYASALGLADTHYANPIGLDQKGNYSSARDLLSLSRRLLRIPAFARIADAREAILPSLRPPRRITAINELLYMEPWVTGVKTGHTWKAGYVLVGSGSRKGVGLISVAIGAPTDETRYSDNLALLEYGFSQYQRRQPIRQGQGLAEPSIRYAGGELPLRASRTLSVGARTDQELTVRVRAPQEVEGPIRRGARLGEATVYVDGMRAGAVPLRAGRSIPEASRFDRARDFVEGQLIPIAIAAFVILMVVALLLVRRARRNDRGSGAR